MKKILLILSTTILFSNVAQAQNTISFETSEGYNLGSIENQNNWFIYGPDEDENYTPEVIVTDNRATNGNQSFRITAQNVVDFIGGSLELNPYQENFSISMDVYVESTFDDLDFGSEILLDLLDQDYNPFVQFNFSFDNAIYCGTNNFLTQVDDVIYENDRWYTIRYDVNLEEQTFRMYLNNEFIHEETFEGSTELAALDFYMIDMGTSLQVDNVHIQPLANLTTVENLKSKVSIYPNPVENFIHIKTTDLLKNVEIYDSNGRFILSSNAYSVNLNDLKSGVYTIKIETNKSITTKKIIKK